MVMAAVTAGVVMAAGMVGQAALEARAATPAEADRRAARVERVVLEVMAAGRAQVVARVGRAARVAMQADPARTAARAARAATVVRLDLAARLVRVGQVGQVVREARAVPPVRVVLLAHQVEMGRDLAVEEGLVLPSMRNPHRQHHFKRWKAAIDTRPLVVELSGNEELWLASTHRQRSIAVQRETESVALIKAALSQAPGTPLEDIHTCIRSPFAARFPNLMCMLSDFAAERQAELQRTLVVRLQPRGRVYPHVDHGQYYALRDRYHLILESSDGSVLSAGEETVTMHQGELWWFDNKTMHHSENPSDIWRTHVIFDLLPKRRPA